MRERARTSRTDRAASSLTQTCDLWQKWAPVLVYGGCRSNGVADTKRRIGVVPRRRSGTSRLLARLDRAEAQEVDAGGPGRETPDGSSLAHEAHLRVVAFVAASLSRPPLGLTGRSPAGALVRRQWQRPGHSAGREHRMSLRHAALPPDIGATECFATRRPPVRPIPRTKVRARRARPSATSRI